MTGSHQRPTAPARWIVLSAALWACGPGPSTTPPGVDLTPPFVLGVSPEGNAVAVDSRFEVRFSEAMQAARIFWTDAETGDVFADGVVLAPADKEASMVSALGSPPLSDTQRKTAIASRVELSADRTSVTLTPLEPLEPNKAYVLVLTDELADEAGNKLVASADVKVPRVLTFPVQTRPGVDRQGPVPSLVSPAAGTSGVASDIAAIRLQWNEDVDSRTIVAPAFHLVDATDGSEARISGVTLDGTLTTLQLGSLGVPGCQTLCPGHTYRLSVDPSVTDLDGNPAASPASPLSFGTANCADVAAPRVSAASVVAVPSDTSAVITWKTDEPSGSRVEWNVGAQFSGGQRVEGPPAVCTVDVCALPTDPAAFSCVHTVRIEGLSATTGYAFRVVSADGGGRESIPTGGTFTTLPPQPKLVLTEVLAAPAAASSSDYDKYKYVEIYNPGPADVDLAGWGLIRCADSTCAASYDGKAPWEFRNRTAGGPIVLAAGAYAVAGGDKLDPVALGVPTGVLLLRGKTSTTLIAGAVSRTEARAFGLVSASGSIVSSYGAHLGKPDGSASKSKSFERKATAAPDAVDSWAVSTAAIGATGNFGTPGARNSVTP